MAELLGAAGIPTVVVARRADRLHQLAARHACIEVLAAEYGGRFAGVASCGNTFGVQFHPEKSSTAGLRLLENYCGICTRLRDGDS